MTDVQLDISSDRITAGKDGGVRYTSDLEDIRDKLDKSDLTGSSLGNLIEGQIGMTEAELRYQVRTGAPTKASKAADEAAKAVKSS